MIRSDWNEIMYPLARRGFYILHALYVNAKERRALYSTSFLPFSFLFEKRTCGFLFFVFFFAKNVDR